MKHSVFLLFLIMVVSIQAQNSYWNNHTQIISWRLPLPAATDAVRLEDLTGDGTPDVLHSFILDSIPVLWIDDDGDMKAGDLEGDTDNDCLLVDVNKDGIFAGPEDLCVDWVDEDEDGMADLQVVIRNGRADVRYGPDYASDYLCVIDREKDDVKSFIDWRHLALDCWRHEGHANFYQDYHGNTLLLKMHNSSFRVTDPRLSCENPFIFQDCDDDGLTECAVRLMDVPYSRPNPSTGKADVRFQNIPDGQDIMPSGRISWVSLAWDMDNDNGQGNEFDLDLTLHFAGQGFDYTDQVHRFKHMKGLQAANRYLYDSRWRQIDELVYADADVAGDLIFQRGEWDYCWFVFDEDDDCNRWERVENYYPFSLFKIGAGQGGLDSHKQADAVGDRGEFDADNSGRGRLYVSLLDGKIHLYGAEWGAWRIDQGADCFQGYGGLYQPDERERRLCDDPRQWATVRYRDVDGNGFLDEVAYDLDGDTLFEERVSLQDLGLPDEAPLVDVSQMSYDAMNQLFRQSVEALEQRADALLNGARKMGLNTSWYAFYQHPRTLAERYDHAYWLAFYLFRDMRHCLRLKGDVEAIGRWERFYYSGQSSFVADDLTDVVPGHPDREKNRKRMTTH